MLQFHKYWFNIIDVLRFFPCKTRVKWTQNSEPTQWEDSLFIPVQNYLETGKLGPVPMREVEWVEVDPIEIHHIGRLVADRQVDHLEDLVHTLSQRGIAFQQVEQYLRFDPHVSEHTSCTEQTGDRSY